jgi:hypothetical protein
VRVRARGRSVQRVSLLPAGKALPFRTRAGWVEFTAPELETFAMLAVVWKEAAQVRPAAPSQPPATSRADPHRARPTTRHASHPRRRGRPR